MNYIAQLGRMLRRLSADCSNHNPEQRAFSQEWSQSCPLLATPTICEPSYPRLLRYEGFSPMNKFHAIIHNLFLHVIIV